jgi:hypothetical protein
MNFNFDGGIAARIQNLARADSCDARGRHTCDELQHLRPRKQCSFAVTTFPLANPSGHG